MKHDPVRSGKRKAVNLSHDTGIVAFAREHGVNLSQVSEEAISRAAQAEANMQWANDHAARIDAFAAWLDDNGMPFEELRVF